MGQSCLLDGQERPDLIAARAYDADRPCNEQKKEVSCRAERHASREVDCSSDEHAPPPEPVGLRRKEQRDDEVAGKRQRQKKADLRFGESETHEVKHQNHRERAIGKQTRKPAYEQKGCVAAERFERIWYQAPHTSNSRVTLTLSRARKTFERLTTRINQCRLSGATVSRKAQKANGFSEERTRPTVGILAGEARR